MRGRGFEQVTKQTLPEVGQLVRDLRQTSESLRSLTDPHRPAGRRRRSSAARKLPEYEAG